MYASYMYMYKHMHTNKNTNMFKHTHTVTHWHTQAHTHTHTAPTKRVGQLVEEECYGSGQSQRQALGNGGPKGHTICKHVQGVCHHEEQERGTSPVPSSMGVTMIREGNSILLRTPHGGTQ